MGYLHVQNLYKDQTILLFRDCYALEKIHGTSAHISWCEGQLRLSGGGTSSTEFQKLFDVPVLTQRFREQFPWGDVTVYGEAYGGKEQRQAWRYGPSLKFVAFEVCVRDRWLAVPEAEQAAKKLGLEFVHYAKVSTDLAALDAERDAPSEQARRNGVVGDQPREGVVLRPPIEVTLSNGDRIIAKHKRDAERETATPRPVVDAAKREVLENAEAIANEWVTPTRLEHVMQKLTHPLGIEQTGAVCDGMVEDILREGAGELVDSPAAQKAIRQRAARLFHEYLKNGWRSSP